MALALEFAPPLIIQRDEIDFALLKMQRVTSKRFT